MKIDFTILLLILFLISCAGETSKRNENVDDILDPSVAQQYQKSERNNMLTYDISIKELMDINVIDSADIEYEPSYELSIKDLMQMKIVKELRMDTSMGVSYDIPLEDLMKIEVQQKKGQTKIKPNYEMSMQGLLEWQIEEEYKVVDRIELSYEISLNGLMEIKITNLGKKEVKNDSL